MSKDQLEAFPTDILVDATKSREAIFIHPDTSMFADRTIGEAFTRLNQNFSKDPEAWVRFMAKSVGNFRHSGTLKYPANIRFGNLSGEQDADINETLFVTSPLNDGRPKSSADRMVRYIDTPEPSFTDIALAQPNSWSPITKLGIGFDFAKASNRPISMVQLFSRLAPHAMSLQERAQMWRGDYSGFGRAGFDALKQANIQRQNEGKTPIEKVHIFGAGMSQRAIGVASWMMQNQDQFEVVSVTAMNLALKRGLGGAAMDHMGQTTINEPSGIILPKGFTRIEEPLARQTIDHRGSDTFSMMGRQAWAIKDASYIVPFSTMCEPTLKDIQIILNGGVSFRVVNGLNVGMNVNTLRYLPIGDRLVKYSTIVGLEGQKVGMGSNEHAGAVAIAMSLGIRDYDALREGATQAA